MTRAIGNFTPANPGEVEPFALDFTTSLPAGVTVNQGIPAVWGCTLLSGSDPNPTARLSGAPYFTGTNETTQLAGNWYGDSTYALSATIRTSTGLPMTLWANMYGEIIGCGDDVGACSSC